MNEVGIVKADAQTMLTLGAPDETVRETRKGKDGEYHETGVLKSSWVYKANKTALIAGGGLDVAEEDGSVSVYSEVRVTTKQYSAEALRAEREAKAFDRIVPEVRKRLGLSKSKQAVSDRDKLTDAMLGEWLLGTREIMGKSWDSLPMKVKDGVLKVRSEAASKAGKAVKPASPTQVMQALAAALEANGLLDEESKTQVEILLARQAKAKAAASNKQAEVTE